MGPCALRHPRDPKESARNKARWADPEHRAKERVRKRRRAQQKAARASAA